MTAKELCLALVRAQSEDEVSHTIASDKFIGDEKNCEK